MRCQTEDLRLRGLPQRQRKAERVGEHWSNRAAVTANVRASVWPRPSAGLANGGGCLCGLVISELLTSLPVSTAAVGDFVALDCVVAVQLRRY